MLEITIPKGEFYNEDTNEFIYTKETTIHLEHSLVSVSKWESIWHKPFISSTSDSSIEETISYISCMTIEENIDPLVYNNITNDIIQKVNNYVNDTMTAIHFREESKTPSRNRDVMTSEVIYYYMIANNIPFEPCEHWHLSRLINLIRVCQIKNAPPKKMSKEEIRARNSALNAARRAKLNSKG